MVKHLIFSALFSWEGGEIEWPGGYLLSSHGQPSKHKQHTHLVPDLSRLLPEFARVKEKNVACAFSGFSPRHFCSSWVTGAV